MLTNLRDNHDLIVILNDMQDKFHLTGSRYFGTHTSSSDIDYFAEYSEELKEDLLIHGFKVLSSSQYKDSNTNTVLRGQNWNGI